MKAGVIWAGTDDGHLQVTEDFGGKWTDRTEGLTALGAPAAMWVSQSRPQNRAQQN